MLLQPAFHRNGTRQRCRSQQIVATAVAVGTRRGGLCRRAMCLLAQSGQSIIFPQQGDNGFTAAEAGDKGIRNPAGFTGQGETFRFQRAGNPFRGPELFKTRFRVIPDIVGNVG